MQVIEAAPLVDIFASDMARMEVLGANVRFVLYARRQTEEGGAEINVAVASIVMPIDVIPNIVARVLFGLGHEAPPIAVMSRYLN